MDIAFVLFLDLVPLKIVECEASGERGERSVVDGFAGWLEGEEEAAARSGGHGEQEKRGCKNAESERE